MELLLFSGSLRKESFNRKLINAVTKILSKNKNITVKVIDLKSLDIPVYDGDIETEGIPKGVRSLGEAISKCDGVIISSPEYNRGIAGAFKNVIDWQSRLKPVPFEGKSLFLMSASPGSFGAIRGLDQAKPPFLALGARLFSEEFSIPKAHEAFTSNDELKDQKQSSNLEKILEHFLAFVKTSDQFQQIDMNQHPLNSKYAPEHQQDSQSH